MAAALLLVCAAFVASFAFGIGSRDTVTTDIPPAARAAETPAAAGRVEVLNASGRSGMARAATQHLRSAGFDVVYFGNAPASAGDSSMVIDRTGNPAIARSAGAQLGIARITSRPDSTLYIDATVLVGRDWVPGSELAGNDEQGWRARIARWLGRR